MTDLLPKPVPLTPPRREELQHLLEECLASYQWEQHLQTYAAVRAEGQKNYADVLEAQRRGEDITDLVLERLLPHVNTTHNRETNRWIHLAPSITRDIKTWYEGSGWTKPEDWPEISRQIFRFITSCVDDPATLPTACETFSALPVSTGFQSGTLSPILNALRPDDFCLINNKSRQALNYFSANNHGPALEDYPAANATLLRFVDATSDLLTQPGLEAFRPVDIFDMFTHWLVAEKKFSFRVPSQKYWKVAPGAKAWHWSECLDGGFISIGWDELGDLSGLSQKEFHARRDEWIARDESLTKTALNQLWQFSRMAVGDTVVANNGTSQVIGLGQVTGPYYYDEKAPTHKHRVPVEWYDTEVRKVDQPGWRRTLIKLDQSTVESIENAPLIDQGFATTITEPLAEHQPLDPEESIDVDETILREPAQNIIFFGPPGTGKTWSTKTRAVQLCLRLDVDATSEEYDRDFRRLRREGRIEFLTFHQSFAYEEFVEGIRPVMEGEGDDEDIRYQIAAGTFKAIALQAAAEGVQRADGLTLTDEQRLDLLHDYLLRGSQSGVTLNFEDADDYVLIIDEINRGNISKILGELITLLEPSKRLTEPDELIVRLPYSKERFAVPPNLHIIGTMNTADRSIALMDVALRRRFHFEEMRPDWRVIARSLDDTLSDEVYGGKEDFINLVCATFENINARIEVLYDQDHQLGHSYFLKLTGLDSLRKVFLNDVIPLLQEYFYGSWERICMTLGCPYDAYGAAARVDNHGLDGHGYRAPLITAASLLERDILGIDPDQLQSQQRFAINPRLMGGGLEPAELKEFFLGLLSGAFLEAYQRRRYTAEFER